MCKSNTVNLFVSISTNVNKIDMYIKNIRDYRVPRSSLFAIYISELVIS